MDWGVFFSFGRKAVIRNRRWQIDFPPRHSDWIVFSCIFSFFPSAAPAMCSPSSGWDVSFWHADIA
jgi:hypothetical protein